MNLMTRRAEASLAALSGTGLSGAQAVHANLQAAPLVELALQRGEGKLSADGALVVAHGHAHRPLGKR